MKHAARLIAILSVSLPSSAMAWGYEGHEIIADIARAELTPAVRAKVDAILATDTDVLTGPDMAARATWADAWRSAGHRETAQWHFVDTEIDGSATLDAACFNHPAPDQPASAGPAQDCVVDKVREFAVELSAPDTTPAERLLALKYLLHFVGDEHQPLHASDNHDRGGNCVLLSNERSPNLHAYWDTAVVEAMGRDPAQVAGQLSAQITPALRRQWQQGDPTSWAQEASQVARLVAYTAGSSPGCPQGATPITLPNGYAARAQAAAALQLERAGVRLGLVLNQALAAAPVAAIPVVPVASVAPPDPVNPAISSPELRSSASLGCSTAADAKALHGAQRKAFRRTDGPSIWWTRV